MTTEESLENACGRSAEAIGGLALAVRREDCASRRRAAPGGRHGDVGRRDDPASSVRAWSAVPFWLELCAFWR